MMNVVPSQIRHVLFVSLGQSQAIVPEAFLLPGVTFTDVRVLTTAKPRVHLITDFFKESAPQVRLQITRVKEFEDFRDEHDHFRFEEILYRWVITSGTHPEQRWICLAGGFKTMSAAMQKTAAVLGAREVFHVLADSVYKDEKGKPIPPSTIPQILEAKNNGHLHYIRLGAESGWPQFLDIASKEYPLEIEKDDQEGIVEWADCANQNFREHLKEIVQRSHHISNSWEQISHLPFTTLATWSSSQLVWLGEPMDIEKDINWIKNLPKIDLHCHLGGFATQGDLLEKVRGAALTPSELPSLFDIPPYTGWPLPAHPIGLEPYRKLGDNNGSSLLKDPGCLRKQCELLYEYLLAENVVYAEIRCSPANYSTPHRSPWRVLQDIKETFDQCMASHPGCFVNLLLIGTRQVSGDFRAGIARHLALAITAAENWTDERKCRVVGVDLAGYEDRETRPHFFREEFVGVHRCGLALTVHAGENDDAEAIWSAVYDLNARRIGHGLHLIDSPSLMRSVADRGIGVEMCPYANLQIKGFRLDSQNPDKRSYPLKDYLDKGVKVSINTDNIGISAASLTDNMLLAARLCPSLNKLDMLKILRHSLDTSFISSSQHAYFEAKISEQILFP